MNTTKCREHVAVNQDACLRPHDVTERNPLCGTGQVKANRRRDHDMPELIWAHALVLLFISLIILGEVGR